MNRNYELSLNTQELHLFYCLIANTPDCSFDNEIKYIGVYYYISGLIFHVCMIL